MAGDRPWVFNDLSWKKVRVIVEAMFADRAGTLVVYEEFVAGGSAEEPGSQAKPSLVRTSGPGKVSESSLSPRVRKGRGRASRPDGREGGEMGVINFYGVGDEYGCFSNFSPHPVVLKGKTWPTSEHYFQAQKFVGTPDEEEVRRAKSPMIAARMGRSRKRPLRKDWESSKDRIMHEAVLAKFTQHADLREILLGTGDSKIVEHTANDAYWGDGGDGSGKNRLGQILMRLREELRSSESGS